MVLHELGLAGATARVVRSILVVDVVESVRLIEQHEDDVVARWRAFVDHVNAIILPAHDGRLVKSLGDGMVLEFQRAPSSLAAAFAIQAAASAANEDIASDRRIELRIGTDVGTLIADERDVYGHRVNLAARLASLARPGEIVVSADVRDQITPALDAEVEDLGECYLKNLMRPVRAYRVAPPRQHDRRPTVDRTQARFASKELLPTIAVIPFQARSFEPQDELLGEILADEVIGALSRTAHMHVISRLSTTAFRWRDVSTDDVSRVLNASYVLTGSYRVSGTRVVVLAQLAESRRGRVVWSAELKGQVQGILNGDAGLIERVVNEVSAAMMTRELERARSQSLPTLESYALLLGAIALMHRLSRTDFDQARDLLQALIDRTPRQAVPYAWLAKWHVLRVQQGWCDDPTAEAQRALAATRRALDLDVDCALALAIDGFVHTNLLRQFDVALNRYETALAINPNESIAWLLKGTLHAFKGEGTPAMKDTRHALKLSPLDPLRYFYDSLAATAALAAGKYDRARDLALRSLRLNRTHTSTLRALAIAQLHLGEHETARATVKELLAIDPGFTVSKFVARSPSTNFQTGPVWAAALRAAGVPE